MAQLNIDVSDDFQKDFEALLQETARKVIAEIVSNPLERKEYLNKKETCQLLGISFNTLKQMEAMGLKVIQIQGKQLISKKTLTAFLQAHEN
jgi:hypothetical protein